MPIATLALGVLLLLAGCAGTGQVVPLKIQALPSARPLNQNFQDIKVIVEPFEEGPEAGRVGVRSHLGGGETFFTTQGGRTGEMIAQVVADNLKSMGFQVWTKKPGATELPADPDVTITGLVHRVFVRAQSRFFSTRMTGKLKVMIQAANVSDRSTVHLNLEGGREDAVFWFEPGQVQELVNRMLKENLGRLLGDIRVQNRALLTK